MSNSNSATLEETGTEVREKITISDKTGLTKSLLKIDGQKLEDYFGDHSGLTLPTVEEGVIHDNVFVDLTMVPKANDTFVVGLVPELG